MTEVTTRSQFSLHALPHEVFTVNKPNTGRCSWGKVSTLLMQGKRQFWLTLNGSIGDPLLITNRTRLEALYVKIKPSFIRFLTRQVINQVP